MRKMRVLVVGSVVLVAAIGFAIFTSHSSAAPSAKSGKPLQIAFIVRQTNNPVFDAMAKGAQKAAKELGGKLEVVGPSTSDATGQIPYIQTLTAKHADGLFISANDQKALDGSLNKARSAGITVVGMDSPPDASARDAFVSDGSTQDIGIVSLVMMCQELPNCTGNVAIISGAANSPNQNAWVAVMRNAINKDPKYSKIKLVKVAYGNDDPQVATTVAQGILQQFPNLNGLMLPSSVAMVATAQVLEQTHKAKKVLMTGLALPSQMRRYVQDGTVKQFSIWNMANLGYLSYWVTYNLHTGKLKAKPGTSFKAGDLGMRTVGPQGVISVGKPAIIDKKNIGQFNF